MNFYETMKSWIFSFFEFLNYFWMFIFKNFFEQIFHGLLKNLEGYLEMFEGHERSIWGFFRHQNVQFLEIRMKTAKTCSSEKNTFCSRHYMSQSKGIYNRLPLIMGYLFDIDLALWSLLLPWEVKFNKSWITFFAVKH